MNVQPSLEIATAQQRPSGIDRLAGFVAPLCLYLDPASQIFLSTSDLTEANLAFPISLIVAPFFMLYAFHQGFQRHFKTTPLTLILIALFAIYCLIMASIISVTQSSDAMLYAIQWLLCFAWLPYCLTIIKTPRFHTFIRWFFIGVIVNLAWYFSSAAIEFVVYGGLGDGGRMTQNRILPGQYQIAVYVPTVIAISVSLVNAMALGKLMPMRRWTFLALNGVAFLTLLALAAREGLLVYVMTTGLFLMARNPNVRALAVIGAIVAGALLVVNLGAILDSFAASELRILNKIAVLREDEARFSYRDVMIKDALQIFWWDPVFGSRFLPPSSSHFGDAIRAPSAHNMYVDSFVWTGILGGILFCTIVARFLWTSVMMVLSTRSPQDALPWKLAAIVFIVFLVVSNNTNVPMRQPVVAPLVALMIAICLSYGTKRKASR